MKILVTGGSGFVGGHLIESLLRKKYEVYCVCRETSDLQYLESLPHSTNLKFLRLDLSIPCHNNDAFNDIVKEVDYIYHLAGLIKAYRPEDYDNVNFLATKHLIETVIKINNKNLKRFLHLSSLAAAGPSDNIKGVNEESPCHPISYYGKSKLKGEIVVSGYKELLPVTILRPPPVYGARDKGLLFFFKASGYGIRLQFSPKKYVSLIYVKDLVDAIIFAAEDYRSTGQTYFVANRNSYSINSIIDIINNVVNNNTVTVKLSDGLIRKVARLYEGFCYLLGLEPTMVNSQKALELSQNYWTCQTEKIKIHLGFEASVSIEKGIQETAKWYIENKWI